MNYMIEQLRILADALEYRADGVDGDEGGYYHEYKYREAAGGCRCLADELAELKPLEPSK
jgi:hypothetical protein